MHQYSTDKTNRERVIYVLVIVSVALSHMLKVLFSGTCTLLSNMIGNASSLAVFAETIQSAELIPNIIGVPVVYWILSKVFDKWLWKTRLMKMILKIPDLNGVWKGTLHSSYDEMDYEMVLEIKQTWNRIQCTSKFKSSQSYSNVAALYSKGPEGDILYFGFHNQSNVVEIGNQQYDGYNILRLGGDELCGKYFNDRSNIKNDNKGGNLGIIALIKQKSVRDKKKSEKDK